LLLVGMRRNDDWTRLNVSPVVLLAHPFRFRCEINLAREAIPAWAVTPDRSAHYESVDKRF
jgi:hypothetical protein